MEIRFIFIRKVSFDECIYIYIFSFLFCFFYSRLFCWLSFHRCLSIILSTGRQNKLIMNRNLGLLARCFDCHGSYRTFCRRITFRQPTNWFEFVPFSLCVVFFSRFQQTREFRWYYSRETRIIAPKIPY